MEDGQGDELQNTGATKGTRAIGKAHDTGCRTSRPSRAGGDTGEREVPPGPHTGRGREASQVPRRLAGRQCQVLTFYKVIITGCG